MSVMPSTVEQWLDNVPANGQAPDEMPTLDPVQLDMSLAAHLQPGLDMVCTLNAVVPAVIGLLPVSLSHPCIHAKISLPTA